MCEPLTIGQLATLATIQRLTAVRRVAWLDSRDEVQYGVVRSIGDERGGFIARDADVRDAFLRITTERGFEWFAPMREIMAMVEGGTFVQD